MQTIATKLSRVTSAAPAGWTADDCRHLIHGTGGSPRRARRLLKAHLDLATKLRDAYIEAIEAGTAHSMAVAEAGRRFNALAGADESEDDGQADTPAPKGWDVADTSTEDTPAAPPASTLAQRIAKAAVRKASKPGADVAKLKQLALLG